MLGQNLGGELQPGEVGASQQGGLEQQLRHHHFHAGMGVMDPHQPLHQRFAGARGHGPVGDGETQGRGGPQPVSQLQPEEGKAEEAGADQGDREQ